MGTTRKTITVTEQQNEWIKAPIDSGAFTSDSEYIRDPIRRDHDSQSEVDAIRGQLIQGEERRRTPSLQRRPVQRTIGRN